jgi:hypothetical protein
MLKLCSDFLLSAVNSSIKTGGLSVAAPRFSALVTGSPELPELPLYTHATFKDPGGVASTRQ